MVSGFCFKSWFQVLVFGFWFLVSGFGLLVLFSSFRFWFWFAVLVLHKGLVPRIGLKVCTKLPPEGGAKSANTGSSARSQTSIVQRCKKVKHSRGKCWVK